MTNRILRLELTTRSTIPAEAEVHLRVWTESLAPGLSVRARLMGPRCWFAGTIEVAYPFHCVLVPTSSPAFTLRAVVPEACLWDPVSPHLYYGPVELWQDQTRLDQRPMCHGLRSFALGPRGLRINGKLTPLVGQRRNSLNEAEALQLRQQGINLIVVPAEAPCEVWEVADRIGLLVLSWIENSTSLDWLTSRAQYASCLGWLATSVSSEWQGPPGTILGTTQEMAGAFTLAGDELLSTGTCFGRLISSSATP